MYKRSYTQDFSVRHYKDRSQRLQNLISAVCLAALLIFAILLSLLSRPLADEHVQLALAIGFLDESLGSYDYRGTSVFLRFIRAIVFLVQHGWDSATNSVLFQISPAYLNAIHHGLGSSFLAIVVVTTWYAFCYYFNGDPSLNHKILASLCLTTGLTVALRVAPFGVAFDLFALTGVRFSLYFVHAVALFYWVERHVIRSSSERRNLLVSVIFLMIWSLWFSTIWLLLSFLRAAIPAAKRQWLIARNRLATVVLGLILMLTNNWFFIGLFERVGVEAGNQRSRDLFSNLDWAQTAVDIVLLALGPQFFVGVLFGVLISYISIEKRRELVGGVELSTVKRSNLQTVLVYLTLVIGIASVFQVQEFITYPAYWHRTFPIVVSYLGGTRVTILILARSRLGNLATRRGLQVRLPVAFAMSFLLIASTSGLRAHARDYDAGNVTSTGWAVGNTQEWVLPTLLRIGPDLLRNWTPPRTLLTEADLVVAGTTAGTDGSQVVIDSDEVNEGGRILTLESPLTVTSLPLRYSEELGGSVEVTFHFWSQSAATLTVIHQSGKRSTFWVSPGGTRKSVDIALPGNLSIVCMSDQGCQELQITGVNVDFTSSFKRKWSQ